MDKSNQFYNSAVFLQPKEDKKLEDAVEKIANKSIEEVKEEQQDEVAKPDDIQVDIEQ